MRDIEDDPEFRANVNLYRDDDIIGQLEAKISGLTLEESSKLEKNLESGTSRVGSDDRQVKKAVRKTAIGKAIQHQSEKNRMKSELMIKANMKTKDEMKKDGDSDWESAEDDAPAIKLEDLLDNLKIDDRHSEDEDEEEEEESKE